jgi:hypothetical protein
MGTYYQRSSNPCHAGGAPPVRRGDGSPPPCGEGSGVGVTNKGDPYCKNVGSLPRSAKNQRDLPRLHPTPNPSPSRGGESRLPGRRAHLVAVPAMFRVGWQW